MDHPWWSACLWSLNSALWRGGKDCSSLIDITLRLLTGAWLSSTQHETDSFCLTFGKSMKAAIQDVKRNVDSKLGELCPIWPRVFAPQLDLTALSTLNRAPYRSVADTSIFVLKAFHSLTSRSSGPVCVYISLSVSSLISFQWMLKNKRFCLLVH